MAVSGETDLAGTLAELEQERLAAFGKIKTWVAGALGLTGSVTLIFYLVDNGLWTWITPALGACVVAFICFYFIGQVKDDFKRKVMPILVRGIDPSLVYDMKRFVGEGEFQAAGLFARPDRYSGKDFVEGNIGETAVRFSLIHAEEEYTEIETDSNGRTRTVHKYRTIFQGLFFIADFNKHFSACTKVEPHGVNFFDKMFGSHVELEDPDFNKHFSVSSSDQVEARYILTPSFMERLLALHEKVGTFRTAFAQEHLFMAIPSSDSVFEPSVRHSLAESQQVEKILGKLKSITGIVEDLGLNVRIWTKE